MAAENVTEVKPIGLEAETNLTIARLSDFTVKG